MVRYSRTDGTLLSFSWGERGGFSCSFLFLFNGSTHKQRSSYRHEQKKVYRASPSSEMMMMMAMVVVVCGLQQYTYRLSLTFSI